MLDISCAKLTKIATCWVGNQNRYEGVGPVFVYDNPNAVLEEAITASFLAPFAKTEEMFQFREGDNNTIGLTIDDIFKNKEKLSASANVLRDMLYDCMQVPKARGGDFFVAHFSYLILNDSPVDAVCLVKVNTKHQMLRVDRSDSAPSNIGVIEAISTAKLELAAIIFNEVDDSGFHLFAIDTVSKKDERSFWKDEFLRIKPANDDYFNTRHAIALTSEFIREKMKYKFGMSNLQVQTILGQVYDFMIDCDEFDWNDFAELIFQEDKYASFIEYLEGYQKKYAVELLDTFVVSRSALKKYAKLLKANIKLDKNFKISFGSANRQDLVEQGFDDEKGKKYYKVYFDQEEI